MTNQSDNREASGAEGWSTIGRSASSPGEEYSDERMCQDVCDHLMQYGDVDCTEIDVLVVQGVVTLRGNVRTSQIQRQAAELAQGVAGVREVQNQLQVAEQ